MKALAYQGDGKVALIDKDKPKIQEPTDAVIKVVYTTICGTDLHILAGDVPTVTNGRTLGHEGVGVVEEVGSAVRHFKAGDRVLISAISSCSTCLYCHRGMYGQCTGGGGWLLGHLVDGMQAEYIRIPLADGGLHKVPEGVDEKSLVMFSDIMPTGYECAVLQGKIQPGNTVAIVGAGPVGLASLLTAKLLSPSKIIMIDTNTSRLELAKKLGADHTIDGSGNTVEEVHKLTGGIGVDTAVEAVGYPQTLELCQDIVAPGGTIANVGVHGKACTLKIDQLWIKDIILTTRLVDTTSTPMLLKLLSAGKLDGKPLITHEISFSDMENAYSMFAAAAKHSALKLLLKM